MHKPDQSELQLDQSRLPYSKHLGQISQKAAQPNIAKKAHYITPINNKFLDFFFFYNFFVFFVALCHYF